MGQYTNKIIITRPDDKDLTMRQRDAISEICDSYILNASEDNPKGDIEEVSSEYLKEQFGIFKREMENRGFPIDGTTPLKCPNCQKDMLFTEQVQYKGETYDEWECEECAHIIALDFRGS